jgi:hypothetical protein
MHRVRIEHQAINQPVADSLRIDVSKRRRRFCDSVEASHTPSVSLILKNQ